MKILLLLSFVIYLAAAQIPTFSKQYAYVINKCVNNTGSSSIFRCSDYGIWKITYPYTETCSGYGYQSATYAGCDESTNAYYDVIGCESALTMNGENCGYIVISGEPVPLGVCTNSGTSSSYYYECVNGVNVTKYTYSTKSDCEGNFTSTTNYSSSLYEIQCGSNNCSALATKYTTSYSCSFDGIKYKPGDPRSKSCKYFIDDSSNANAIDQCFSGRAGFAEYSAKYTCTDSGDVELWAWLDSEDCDGTKYLVSTYTSNNYTIHCDGTKCGHKIRSYDDCSYKNVYSETPLVWNQCFKYYDGNQSGSEPSYNDAIYYMNTCIGGYYSLFFYTDSECKDSSVFYIDNTTGSCSNILTGCSNPNYSPGYLVTPMSFYSVIVMIIAMVYVQ